MSWLLDAGALIALIKDEQGGSLVDSLLNAPQEACMVHALNLCEVYYEVYRLAGEDRAKETIRRLILAGLTVYEDMDIDLWQEAGKYKATIKKVSLADCVCVALAGRLGVDILTTDRHEFLPLVEQNLCRARFIR